MMISIVYLILTLSPQEPLIQKNYPIEGIYSVKGTEGDKHYVGACVIRNIDKDAYHVVCVTGKTVIQGIAIKTGDNLAISWSDGKAYGITVYRITGRNMHGRWSQTGIINREQLNYLGDLPED